MRTPTPERRPLAPHVESVLEALARLAPRQPITSLREHTRAHALRRTARTCYGHLAGQLGVRLYHGMIAHGWVTGNDECINPPRQGHGSPLRARQDTPAGLPTAPRQP